MPTINEIAREVMLASACLRKAHKLFNELYTENKDGMSKEEHVAWQAVVAASDALRPVDDWMMDNS